MSLMFSYRSCVNPGICLYNLLCWGLKIVGEIGVFSSLPSSSSLRSVLVLVKGVLLYAGSMPRSFGSAWVEPAPLRCCVELLPCLDLSLSWFLVTLAGSSRIGASGRVFVAAGKWANVVDYDRDGGRRSSGNECCNEKLPLPSLVVL